MAEDYEIIAGHIKEKQKSVTAKTGGIETVIKKQEMFGSGDMKAYQTALEELEATKAAEASEAV